MAFCKNFNPKVRKLLKKIDDALNDYLGLALSISGKIKSILSSPMAYALTDIIPGDKDDAMHDKAVGALGYTIDALTALKAITEETDVKKKLDMFLAELSERQPEYKEAMLFKIASLLTKSMHGGVLTQAEYDVLVQGQYMNKKDEDKK